MLKIRQKYSRSLKYTPKNVQAMVHSQNITTITKNVFFNQYIFQNLLYTKEINLPPL